MTLEDRVMEGFILIDAGSVEEAAALQRWVDLALDYNATLPAKSAKSANKKQRS